MRDVCASNELAIFVGSGLITNHGPFVIVVVVDVVGMFSSIEGIRAMANGKGDRHSMGDAAK